MAMQAEKLRRKLEKLDLDDIDLIRNFGTLILARGIDPRDLATLIPALLKRPEQ